jgi:hypothetical protein
MAGAEVGRGEALTVGKLELAVLVAVMTKLGSPVEEAVRVELGAGLATGDEVGAAAVRLGTIVVGFRDGVGGMPDGVLA